MNKKPKISFGDQINFYFEYLAQIMNKKPKI